MKKYNQDNQIDKITKVSSQISGDEKTENINKNY